jgi:hypothetical protein
VFLTVRELHVVRAALVMALDEDASAWEALSPDDQEAASNLLYTLPDLTSSVGVEEVARKVSPSTR